MTADWKTSTKRRVGEFWFVGIVDGCKSVMMYTENVFFLIFYTTIIEKRKQFQIIKFK